MLLVLKITGLIVSALIAIYFWELIPDAFTGLAYKNSPNPKLRILAEQRGYGVWMIIVRLIIALLFTALTAWITIKIFF